MDRPCPPPCSRPGRSLRSGVAALMLAVGLFLSAAPASAQSAASIKAGFIPKFVRYVDWPASVHPSSGQSFQLCIVGVDPFGPLIDRAAASEQIEGRAVTVRRLETLEGAGTCHVAFIRGATPAATSRFLRAFRGHPVLTITDSAAGAPRGMIHFALVDGRVRFYIDEAGATAHGLTISSRLLALALGVRQRRG